MRYIYIYKSDPEIIDVWSTCGLLLFGRQREPQTSTMLGPDVTNVRPSTWGGGGGRPKYQTPSTFRSSFLDSMQRGIKFVCGEGVFLFLILLAYVAMGDSQQSTAESAVRCDGGLRRRDPDDYFDPKRLAKVAASINFV